jgi:hypothetical protein
LAPFIVSRCSLDEQGLLADGAPQPDVQTDVIEDVPIADVVDAAPPDVIVDTGPDASFTPSDLGGLVLWLRSDRGLNISGGKFASWSDQSTNGNDAKQTVAANQPVYNTTAPSLNNQPTLSFTASASTFLRIADNASLQPSNLSAALVARYTAQNPYQALISRTTSGNWNDGWALSNGPVANYGQVEFWTTNLNTNSLGIQPIGTWHLWLGTYDGAAVTLYIDGTKETPSSATGGITYPPATDTLIGAYWGAASATPSGFANIDLAEVIVYGRGLSATEVAEIHAYAMARYKTP